MSGQHCNHPFQPGAHSLRDILRKKCCVSLGVEGGVLCLGTDRQLRLAPGVKGLRAR
jgi:hypothetical protein